MKDIIIYGILLLALSHRAFSQTLDNAELERMYNEDQGARKVQRIDWVQLNKDDSVRERRVYEMLDSGRVVTGRDHYHAAMIYQHGKDTTASSMAVKMMKRAIELDSTVNRWLLAAAIDRDLMRRDEPQIYGTQFIMVGQGGKWELYEIDTTQITDAERKYYGVESLAEQRIKERGMNLLPIDSIYANANSIEQTVERIAVEKQKGASSEYGVSESQVNSFAYKLLRAKKEHEALAVFQLNTQLYPEGFNAFDSLGECLVLLNKKEEAIKAYGKSLELNPENEGAIKALNKLR